MQSGRLDEKKLYLCNILGIATDTPINDLIEKMFDHIIQLQEEDDSRLLEMAPFYCEAIIELANSDDNEKPDERGDLFHSLAAMFMQERHTQVLASQAIKLTEETRYHAVALRCLQAIPIHQQTLDDLNEIIDLITCTLQTKQLNVKHKEEIDTPRNQRQPDTVYLNQSAQLLERLRTVLPYRLKAADMDKVNARIVEKEIKQLFDLEMPEQEKGRWLREIARDYMDTAPHWDIGRAKFLLEEAGKRGDTIARVCFSHCERLKKNAFFFRCYRLMEKNFSNLKYGLELFRLVDVLPAQYQTVREGLLDLLAGNIDKDAFEQEEARLLELDAVAKANKRREKEIEEMLVEFGRLVLKPDPEMLEPDPKLLKRYPEMFKPDFEQFASSIEQLLRELSLHVSKHFAKDFSAIKNDDTKLKKNVRATTKRYINAVNKFVNETKEKEKKLIVCISQQEDAKALQKAEYELGKMRNIIKNRNPLFHQMAALLKDYFPSAAHSYLAQIPVADLSVDEMGSLVEITFELDDMDEEACFRSAMPLALKVADSRHDLTPKILKLCNKAINIDMPKKEKIEFLMQIAWDYIKMGTRWQLSHVLPLWEAAADCGDALAEFCVEHAASLENNKFFFDCTQQLIKHHFDKPQDFEQVASLIAKTEALPIHYKTARTTLRELLFADQIDWEKVKEQSSRLSRCQARAKRSACLVKNFNALDIKLEPLKNALNRQSEIAQKTGDEKNCKRFRLRAKFVELIARHMQEEIQGFATQDFSKAKVDESLDYLCDLLIQSIRAFANRVIELDEESAAWSRQVAYVLGVELQIIFEDIPSLNKWVAGLKSLLPVGFKFSIAALHEPHHLSFFTKHRTTLLMLGVGVLLLALTVVTGGFALGWLAALPLIVSGAIALSNVAPVVITATMLAEALVAAAALLSSAVGSLVTFVVSKPALISSPANMPKLDDKNKVEPTDTKSIRARLAEANFTQAELKDLHAACLKPARDEPPFSVTWFKSFGVQTGSHVSQHMKTVPVETMQHVIRDAIIEAGDEFVLKNNKLSLS